MGRRRERRVHVARTTALPFRAGLLDRPGMLDGSRHAAERVTPGPFGIALGGVVLLVPFLGLVHAFWPFTVDDTFITLRYARNLAVGEGLVWNPGQVPPAEGYTSFAWTVLLAPVHAWATDAEAWAKALGFVATVITIGLAMALAREATASRSPYEQRLAMLVTAAVLAWDVATAVHAVSGMDTAPFTMVTTAAMLCAARTLRTPSSAQFRRMTLLALAVGLTRPEGNLVLLVLFIVVGCTLPRAHARGLLRTFLVGFVLPASVYFAWRFAHYGLLFPLPFYVKAVEQTRVLAGADEAWAFVREFVLERPLLGVALCVGVWRAPRALRPALLAALALFLFFLKPAPLMAYNHRYLHPIVPLLGACVGAGTVHLAATLTARRKDPRGGRIAVVLAMLVVADAAWATRRALPGHLAEKLSYAEGLAQAHVRLAQILARAPAHGRIALLDVGAVAYRSRWEVLDTFGLNEPHIARHGRGDAAYVLAQSPDLVVVVSREADRTVPVFPYERALFTLATAAGYRAVASFEFVPDYHLRVLALPDTRAAEIFEPGAMEPRA